MLMAFQNKIWKASKYRFFVQFDLFHIIAKYAGDKRVQEVLRKIEANQFITLNE